MNTNPIVSRFVDRAKITVQPNTRAKADEEGDSYEFSRISPGHYACTHGKNTHIIIEKDGKIGCSCGDMTYRCTGTNACKHIIKFLDLKVPPQIPAPGELIKKLMLMGWVGGKDDMHPAELLRETTDEPETSDPGTVHYECPKCGEGADIEPDKLQDWKLNHIDVCCGTKAKQQVSPQLVTLVAPDSLYEPEDPEYPDHVQPALPDPPNEDYSSCSNTEHDEPLLPSKPYPIENVSPNLATALCNMQKIDLLAAADSDNSFHNAKYADLASVWAAIRKPLTDNGLAVIQTTEQYPNGITVVTTLLHTSGESFTARLSCEIPQSKPDKNGQIKPNIQGLGSTITYLRRYSLTAMVGVAPIDDDGEAAMGRGEKR